MALLGAGMAKLLDRETRPDYKQHVFDGNLCGWKLATERGSENTFTRGTLCSSPGRTTLETACLISFPTWLRDEGFLVLGRGRSATPPQSVARGPTLPGTVGPWSVEDLFHHVLAVLHDPAYREANAGALQDGVAAHPAAGLARW